MDMDKNQKSQPLVSELVYQETDQMFFDSVAQVIENTRTGINSTVNLAMCVNNYEVGRMIVEREQSGENRATYGAKVLERLSAYLTDRCGKGWSLANVKNARQFYIIYSPSIRQQAVSESERVNFLYGFFKTSWTNYLILMRLKDENARSFYEIEASTQNWSKTQLKRQIIDLKRGELQHQDLGQMMMYVNYYDRHVKLDHEKPTVGILLCNQRDSNIVELTLPENSNIYASEYSLYLPDKKLLEQKLAEWTSEFEENQIWQQAVAQFAEEDDDETTV